MPPPNPPCISAIYMPLKLSMILFLVKRKINETPTAGRVCNPEEIRRNTQANPTTVRFVIL